MSLFRKYVLWVLLVASAAFAGYVYLTKKGPCEVPIEYTLGTIDARFNMSKADFASATEEATHIWEDAYGVDLFHYSAQPKPVTRFDYYFTRTPVVVGLEYDSRQKNAESRRTLTSNIDSTKQSADGVKQQFELLQEQYAQAKSEYAMLLEKYQSGRGDRAALEAKRARVNSLTDDINALVQKYNGLVKTVNATVDKVNASAGQEFEEGIYKSDQSGEKITIYEFPNRTTLVRVLAHEFGHALGLDHNSNQNSIMYYLNSSKNFVPTKEDISALKAICEKK